MDAKIAIEISHIQKLLIIYIYIYIYNNNIREMIVV